MSELPVMRWLRFGMVAFGIAAVGGVVNALGWYAFDSTLVARAGFLIAAVGIALGFIAVVCGQISTILRWAKRGKAD